jgi:hypothetical protein
MSAVMTFKGRQRFFLSKAIPGVSCQCLGERHFLCYLQPSLYIWHVD